MPCTIYEEGGGLTTAAIGLNFPPTVDKTPSKSPAKATAKTVMDVFLWTDFLSKFVSTDDTPNM